MCSFRVYSVTERVKSAYKKSGRVIIYPAIAVRLAGDTEAVSKTAMTLPSLYVFLQDPPLYCSVARTGVYRKPWALLGSTLCCEPTDLVLNPGNFSRIGREIQ